VCPKCEMHIVDHVTDPSTQILRAEPGDRPPPVPDKFQGVSWNQLHDCQNYGEKVLLEIPVARWCVCILHMNLRIVGMLFEHTVLRELLKDTRSVDRQDTGSSRAADIYSFLIALGIPTKIISCPVNSVGKFFNSLKKHSFAGSDAAKLLGSWKGALQLAFQTKAWDESHAEYDATSEDSKRYQKAAKAWAFWTSDLWPLINDLTMPKAKKANEVEKKGPKFVKLWIAAAGKATTHLYPHLLVAHLPDQIRNLPVDPWYLQTESLEHKHKFRKLWSFLTSHHAPKALEERVSTVGGYWRRGKWVRGKVGRSTGTCRNYQILAHSLVSTKLHGLSETASSIAHKWERDKAARESRNQRKCVQLLKAHSAGQKTLQGIVLRRSGEEAARRMRECEEVAARALAADVERDEVSESDDQAGEELVEMDAESEDDELLQAL
jgi:hypothetical protein